jgi:hypothetical protein
MSLVAVRLVYLETMEKTNGFPFELATLEALVQVLRLDWWMAIGAECAVTLEIQGQYSHSQKEQNSLSNVNSL